MHRIDKKISLYDDYDDDSIDDDDNKFNQKQSRFLKSSRKPDNFQKELQEVVANRRTPTPKSIETDSDIEIDASSEHNEPFRKENLGLRTGTMGSTGWQPEQKTLENNPRGSMMGMTKDKVVKQNKVIDEYDEDSISSLSNKPKPKNREKEDISFGINPDRHPSKRRSHLFDDSDDIEDPFASNSSSRFLKSTPKVPDKKIGNIMEDEREEEADHFAIKPRTKNRTKSREFEDNQDNFQPFSRKKPLRQQPSQFGNKDDEGIDDPFSLKSSSRFLKSSMKSGENEEENLSYKPRKARTKSRDVGTDGELMNSTHILSLNQFEGDTTGEIGTPQQKFGNNRRSISGNRSIKFEQDNETGLHGTNNDKLYGNEGFRRNDSLYGNGGFRGNDSLHENGGFRGNDGLHGNGGFRGNDGLHGNGGFFGNETTRSDQQSSRASRVTKEQSREHESVNLSPATSVCEEIEVLDENVGEEKKYQKGKEPVKYHTQRSQQLDNAIDIVNRTQEAKDSSLPPKQKKVITSNKYKNVKATINTRINLRSSSMNNLNDLSGEAGTDRSSISCQMIRETAYINWCRNKALESKNRPKSANTPQPPDDDKEARKKEEGKAAYEAWLKNKKLESKSKPKDTTTEIKKDSSSAQKAFEIWKERKMEDEKLKLKKMNEENREKKLAKNREKQEKEKEKLAKIESWNKKKKEEDKSKQQKKLEEEQKMKTIKDEEDLKKRNAKSAYFEWDQKVEDRLKKKKELETHNEKLIKNRRAWKPNNPTVIMS